MRYSMHDLVARVDRLVESRPGKRVVVGIVGPPGSGKSTLSDALVAQLLDHDSNWAVRGARDPQRPWIGSHVASLPMDGFHLADVELARLERANRKGAPDTFDALGYAALLRRIRAADEDVWAPAFDRAIEEPVAGSIPILRSARVIITEGNYLLLEHSPWTQIRDLLDEIWYCDLDEVLRAQRLIARHERFGKTTKQAIAWVTGPDQRNAELIQNSRARADLLITGDVTPSTGLEVTYDAPAPRP
jgi:pantothenate kinase